MMLFDSCRRFVSFTVVALFTLHRWEGCVGDDDVSTLQYVPHGTNPLLYRPGVDPIVQMDETTFAGTVFRPNKPTAYIVEYYADWCGHCRAFTHFYRSLAVRLRNWEHIVKAAAINCADNFNQHVCRSSKITSYPMLKYVPRTAKNFSDVEDMIDKRDVEVLRNQLAAHIDAEFRRMRYEDWRSLEYIRVNRQTRYEDLWMGAKPTTKYLVILFEHERRENSGEGEAKINNASLTDGESRPGVKFILDLTPFRDTIIARRAPSSSPLASMLGITGFPFVALFRRNNTEAVYMEPYHSSTATDVLDRVFAMDETSLQAFTAAPHVTLFPPAPPSPPPPRIVDCETFPKMCKPMYFASEADILRAIRMTLLDEVTRTEGIIEGRNFTHLSNFIDLLCEHFPTSTAVDLDDDTDCGKSGADQPVSSEKQTSPLKSSQNAVHVFERLKGLMEKAAGEQRISTAKYRQTFEEAEKEFGKPFPTGKQEWIHCRGTTPEFRGYTCAVWTVFHALTVHSYLGKGGNSTANRGAKSEGEGQQQALHTLRSIQGWVDSFFGCERCREHFMKMTTEFAIDEKNVKTGLDGPLYLWCAHNIVNRRLHGQSTEDAQFAKFQFPPHFLCSTCRSGGPAAGDYDANFADNSNATLPIVEIAQLVVKPFRQEAVGRFLTSYYTQIYPAARRPQRCDERKRKKADGDQ